MEELTFLWSYVQNGRVGAVEVEIGEFLPKRNWGVKWDVPKDEGGVWDGKNVAKQSERRVWESKIRSKFLDRVKELDKKEFVKTSQFLKVGKSSTEELNKK